ncbi:hypothetical protein CGZ93_13635 [Enemella dayhoffiae]|uniref:Chemotaxis methyl-accepting receptor HlyB-like 4HB MCP domain-containing protein n=1 Tax=Enemella dayhoffiae TaxID=2016507 RepID=A0A255GUM8_9ACTN|nr:hypothetical protein [Enemella dayhoffiae]OYO19395.1 hypothetical protein CGZ93_13635 [Enemella dayhoffiae]
MTAAPAPQQAPTAGTAAAPPGQVAPRPGSTYQPAPRGTTSAPASGVPTPKLLRLLMALCMVTTVLFGGASGAVLLNANHRMGEAVRNTEQLLRVQTIRAEMLRADATMSNSFLLGGQEQMAQQQAYQNALEHAQQLVVEAAEAQPADRVALVKVNATLGRYSRTMEQARDNNRQGFPVGQAYLNDAGGQLRNGMLPVLDSLAETNRARVSDQTHSSQGAWIVVTGVLALAALIATMWLTALRFRRVVNLGLGAATVLVLAGLLTGALTMANNATTSDTVNSQSLATAQAAANARAHGYDAKVYENLTLISRSGGGELEQSWADASWETRYALRRIPDATDRNRLTQLWDTHSFVHLAIRNNDAAGRWDQARELATNDAPTGSNQTFARFDESVTRLMQTSGERATTSLRNQYVGLLVAAGLCMASALAAVAGAGWGIRTRLREYA